MKAVMDVELRSSLKERIKRYYARGYASFKGLDTYRTKLSKKAMEKVSEGLKRHDVRIGVQHADALSDKTIKNLVELRKQFEKEGKNTRLIDEAISYSTKRKLPLGKPRVVEIDENGVFVEVEINPYLRDLDPAYYDAVINMLEDKFIDGFSIEFKNPSTHDEYDHTGRRYSVINDLDVVGLEFVSAASNPGSKISEVFVRMAGFEEGDKMSDKMKELEEKYEKEVKDVKEKLKIAEEKLKLADEKAKKVEEEKEIALKEVKEKQAEEEKSLREELSELKEVIKELKDEGKVSSAKSVVKQEDNPSAQVSANSQKSEEEKVEKLREELDKKDMTELVGELYKNQV